MITRDLGELSGRGWAAQYGWPRTRDRGSTPVTGAEFLSAHNRWPKLAASPTDINPVLQMLLQQWYKSFSSDRPMWPPELHASTVAHRPSFLRASSG